MLFLYEVVLIWELKIKTTEKSSKVFDLGWPKIHFVLSNQNQNQPILFSSQFLTKKRKVAMDYVKAKNSSLKILYEVVSTWELKIKTTEKSRKVFDLGWPIDLMSEEP